jgi:hypothetical protein
MVKSLYLGKGRGGYQLKQDLSTLSTLFPRLKRLVCPLHFPLGLRLAPHLGTFFDLRELDITLPDGLLLPRLLDVRGLKDATIRIRNGGVQVPATLQPLSSINDQHRTLTLDALGIAAHHLDDFILSFLESVHARSVYIAAEHGDISPCIVRLSPITTLLLQLGHDDSPLLPSALSSLVNLRSLAHKRLSDRPLDSTFHSQTLSSLQQLEFLTLDASGSLNSQDLLRGLSDCPTSFRKLTLKGVEPTSEAIATSRGAGIKSREMEEVILDNRLFGWPAGCTPADLRRIMVMGRRRGFEVVGSLVDAVLLTDELAGVIQSRTRLRLELAEMEGRTELKMETMTSLVLPQSWR